MAKRNTKTVFDDKAVRKKAWIDLLNAKYTVEILNALALGLYLKAHGTEPPQNAIPDLGDMRTFIEDDAQQDRGTWIVAAAKFTQWLIRNRTLKEEPNRIVLPKGIASLSELTLYLEGGIIVNRDGFVVSMLDGDNIHKPYSVFGFPEGREKAPSISFIIEDVHTTWRSCSNKVIRKYGHPLAAVIEAWQNRPLEVDSTRRYDEKRPGAIMRFPRGNIDRELFSESEPTGELKRFADNSVIPKLQMVLPGIQRGSVIRNPNKVLLTHVDGVPTQSRRGAVSPELRIFVEAIMQVPPKERIVTVKITVDELIKRLYPNGFNWTNQSPKLLAAIHNTDLLTVPFVNASGNMQYGWAPVKLNTMDFHRRNDDVVFTVTLPEDVKGGPMVEKKIVRKLGLYSAPKWQAYLAMCDLFYRYGVYKGKDGKFYIADPTKPVDRRNDEGYLVNAEGEVIYGPSGKPLSNPYNAVALEQLDREPDQRAIEKYPIVPFEDMLMACFPGTGMDTVKNKRDYMKKAKKHFEELADKFETIRIHERYDDGWRILPAKSHIETYRGVSNKNE